MTDIVERLRKQAWHRSGAPKMDAGHTKMLEWEAADEIERLRASVQAWELIAKHLERIFVGLIAKHPTDQDLHDEIARLQADNERLRAKLERLEYCEGLQMLRRDLGVNAMTDIVERLRNADIYLPGQRQKLHHEAADEIERLRERIAALQASSGYEASIAQVEIERLRAALSKYGDHTYECELKEGKECSCGYEDALK